MRTAAAQAQPGVTLTVDNATPAANQVVTFSASASTDGGTTKLQGIFVFCTSNGATCTTQAALATRATGTGNIATYKTHFGKSTTVYAKFLRQNNVYNAAISAGQPVTIGATNAIAAPIGHTVTTSGSAPNYTLTDTEFFPGSAVPTGQIALSDTSPGGGAIGSPAALGTPSAGTLVSAVGNPGYLGTTAIYTAKGDFNNDGYTDYVVVGSTVNWAVLYGNASGTFTLVPQPALSGAGAGVAVGNFSSGGGQDIVVLTSSAATLWVNDGAGNFSASNTVALGATSSGRGVAVADIDGDGKLDVVFGAGAGGVYVALGQGGTVFGTATTTTLPGTLIYALAAGDMDGDGRTDLVVIPATGTTGSILLNNSNAGSPSFSQGASFGIGGNGGAFNLLVADSRGTGVLDVFDVYPSNLVVNLNNGTGTSTTATSYAISPAAASSTYAQLGAGDFNGDGKLDILLGAPNNNVYLAAGNGDGTFGAPTVTYSALQPQNYGLAVGDFTGNGSSNFLTFSAGTSANPVSSATAFYSGYRATTTITGVSAVGSNAGAQTVQAEYTGNYQTSDATTTITGGSSASSTNLSVTNSSGTAVTTIAVGTTVNLTAKVTPVTATGTVTFYRGTTQIGSPVTLDGTTGVATVSGVTLAAGTYAITAVYSGTAALAGSTSAAATLTVVQATGTQIIFTKAPPTPILAGQNSGILRAAIADGGGNVLVTNGLAITLTVTGPNSYSATYTANTKAGIATFDTQAGTAATQAAGLAGALLTYGSNSVAYTYSLAATYNSVSVTGSSSQTVSPGTVYRIDSFTTTDGGTTGVAAHCPNMNVSPAGTGTCLLRDVVKAVNTTGTGTGPGVAYFNYTGAPLSITLTAANSNLNNNVVFAGPGAAKLTINGSGNQIFKTNSGSSALATAVGFSGMTLQRGANGSGGMIQIQGGNTAGTPTATIANMAFNNATAGVTGNGGAVYATGATGLITIDNSVFDTLNAASGGAVYFNNSSGGSTISNSFFTGNTATGNAGAVYYSTSAIGTNTITNSTFTGNTATGTGTSIAGAIYSSPALSIYNSTIVQNSATNVTSTASGGVYKTGSVSITVTNSIIADNSLPAVIGAFNPDLQVASSGTAINNNSIIGTTLGTTSQYTSLASVGLASTPVVGNTDAGFGDGSTVTANKVFQVLPGGLANNYGNGANSGTPTADQRGFPRATTGAVDAGAAQSSFSLGFTTTIGNTQVNNTFVPQPVVQLLDSGTALANAGTTITLGSSAGTLGVNGAQTAVTQTTDANGTATFASVTAPQKTATGAVLYASAGSGASTISGTSNAFNLLPGALASVVVSAPSPINSGTPFNITVNADDQYGNIKTDYTGTVHFSSSDAVSVLPANSTLTNGTGTFSVTLYTPGTQTVTATDTATSISGTATITVPKITPTLLLSGAPDPSNYTDNITFTATLSPTNAGTISNNGETVTFVDTNTSTTLGTGTLSGGTATFSTSALFAGSYSVQAQYAGDNGFNAANSSTLTQTVNKATPTVTVTDRFGYVAGTSALTATVSGGGVAPTGAVSFTVDSSAPVHATCTAGAGFETCTATYPSGSLTAGGHTITATYTTDTNYLGATGTGNLILVPSSYTAPATNVGAASATQTATILFASDGTLGQINVLTQGALNKEFQFAGGGTCALHTAYTAGQACTVQYTFSPTRPGQRLGGISLTTGSSSSAATLGAVYLNGTGNGPLVTFPASTAISTVGSGFASPSAVAVDAAGNVFVTDNTAVKEIVAVNGTVSSTSTVAAVGSGFAGPSGVAVDGAGNVFVADYGNNAIEEIVAVNGTVSSTSTVIAVGSGFANPHGVAVDGAGNVFVADTNNNAVEEIVAVNGTVSSTSTVIAVGSGFNNPSAVAVDGAGNVFVADYGNNAVKVIVAVNGTVSSSSTVNTVGSGFVSPVSLVVDGSGNVFVVDDGNSTVKEIVAVNGTVSSSSTMNTVGSGFNRPFGVAVDGNGHVFIADLGNSTVSEVDLTVAPAIAFSDAVLGGTTASQTLTVQNSGNAPLTISGIDVSPSDFILDNGFTTCSTGSPLDPGTCLVAVDFVPQSVGAISGTLTLTDNDLNSDGDTQPVTLSGTGTQATPTVTVSEVTINYGDASATLSATVGFVPGFTPTGEFVFQVDANPTVTASCAADTSSTEICTASYSTSSLNAGNHIITGNLAGDTDYIAASGTGTLTVNKVTPSISVSDATITYTDASATLSATVAYPGAQPTGAVSFTVGSGPSVTATCTASAGGSARPQPMVRTGNSETCTATYTTSSLSANTYTITAALDTDSNYNAASGTGTLTVNKATPTVSVSNTSINYTASTATLSATVTYSGVQPTGAVTFTVGSGSAVTATCTPGTGSESCTASYPTSTLTVNTYTITASLAADTNYNAASGTGTLTVNKITPTVSVSNATATYGTSSTTLSAAVTYPGTQPTGAVTFTVGSGSTVTATCTAGTGSETCTASYPTATLTPNTYTITASLATDANYNAASNTGTLTVNKSTPSVNVANVSTTYGTSSTTLSATISYPGVQPGGAVTFTVGSGAAVTATCTAAGGSGTTRPMTPVSSGGSETCSASYPTSSLAPGLYTITASLAADSNYNAVSGTGTLTVNDTLASFTVTGVPSTVYPGVAYTATVTAVGASGQTFTGFTGSVTMSSTDPAAVFNPNPYTYVSGDNGVHTFQVTFHTGGTYSITATSGAATGSETGIRVGDFIWVLSNRGELNQVSESGTNTVSGAGQQGSPGLFGGVAFDSAGNTWSAWSSSNSLERTDNLGGNPMNFTGGGLNAPAAVAVDGAGNVWTANSGNNTVSEFNNSGTAISGSSGYASASVTAPSAVVIDATGGVWTANRSAGTVTHLFGAATPVITPTATAAGNAQLGVKP